MHANLDDAANKVKELGFNMCVVLALNVFAGVRLFDSLHDAIVYLCQIRWFRGKADLIADFVQNKGLQLKAGMPLFPVIEDGMVKLLELEKEVVADYDELARVFTSPGLFNYFASRDKPARLMLQLDLGPVYGDELVQTSHIINGQYDYD